MCGINLIIDKKGLLESDIILKMNEAIAHRGPDHSHHIKISTLSSNIFFGHNRLKIIDLSATANQPFVSADSRYILNYNGEIYNFYDLKNELISRGYIFHTHSDTEVLLNCIIEFGKDALQKIEGMFALMFYDSQSGKMLLARDPFGMKPLYFYEDQYFFSASSEIRGLLASGFFAKELNQTQVKHYLKYRYAKSPETFYKKVFELEPGSALEIDTAFEISRFSFHKQQRPIRLLKHAEVNEEKVLDEVENILTDSLLKHTVAHVPLGLFLSGGVDSTLILALAAKEGLQNITSFSIVNEKKEAAYGTNDYIYAALAAKQFGSTHFEYKITTANFGRFDEFIASIDQPIGDGAAFLTYLLCKEAKSKAKVILTGAGADEMFAGYNRHNAFYKYLRKYKVMVKSKNLLKGIGRILPAGSTFPIRKTMRLYQQFARNIYADPQQTFREFTSYHQLWPEEELPFNSTYSDKDLFIEEQFGKALEHDMKNFLVSDVLALSDRMSMQAGIEMRMPYLDISLFNYLNKLPAVYKIRNGRKWILNEILTRNDGGIFTRRKKEGFGMPFGKWIREKELSYLLESLRRRDNPLFEFIGKETVDKIISEHLNAKQDHGSFLWTLITLDQWLEKNF